MDHSSHASLAFADLTADRLEGAQIYDADDAKIGTVSHLHGEGARSGIVVDTGARLVSVPVSEINFMEDEDGSVHGVLGWTKAQLDAMPVHEHDG